MKIGCKLIIACLSFLILTPAVYGVELWGVDIHGFISQGYLNSDHYNYHADTEDGTFEFNEIGINFGKDLTDRLHIGMQLFSRDLGETGNNEITVDWAYGDYRLKEWVGFRAGKIKMPQGLYNETRDVDALRTAIFLPSSVYPETLRDLNLSMLGGGVYGDVEVGAFGGLRYQLLAGTANLDDDDSRLAYHLRAASQNLTDLEATDISVNARYAMALVWDTPLDGLRLSGTYNQTKLSCVVNAVDPEAITISTDFDSIKNTVASIEYSWEDLVLVAEYIITEYEYTDSNNLGLPQPAGYRDQKSDGWYVGASYRVTDWFELGAYYSQQYNNVDDRDGEMPMDFDPSSRAWLKDFCLTTRFDFNEYLSLKLEGHAFNGTDSLYPIDNIPNDGEDWFDDGDDWYMLAAKVTFTF